MFSRYRLSDGAIVSHLGEYEPRIVSWGRAAQSGAAPGTSLHYMSALSLKPWNGNPATDYHFGLPLQEARAKGLVLSKVGGGDLMNVNYGWPVADIGNPAYHAAAFPHIEARLLVTGSDGVFFDDVVRHYSALTGGAVPVKYPTSSWRTAMLAFCAAAESYFDPRGYSVGFNSGAFTPGDPLSNSEAMDVLWWEELGPFADYLMCEYWQWHNVFPGGPGVRKAGNAWYECWDGFQRLVPLSKTIGVHGLYCCYPTDEAQARYVLCSFLLEDGDGSFIWEPGGNGVQPPPEPWGAMYDQASALGAPTAAKRKNGSRWERLFVNGTVWVDPVAGTSGIEGGDMAGEKITLSIEEGRLNKFYYERWQRDNPGEAPLVLAYLDGGARPTDAQVPTHYGKQFLFSEDARRELVVDPPPPPPPSSGDAVVLVNQKWSPSGNWGAKDLVDVRIFDNSVRRDAVALSGSGSAKRVYIAQYSGDGIKIGQAATGPIVLGSYAEQSEILMYDKTGAVHSDNCQAMGGNKITLIGFWSKKYVSSNSCFFANEGSGGHGKPTDIVWEFSVLDGYAGIPGVHPGGVPVKLYDSIRCGLRHCLVVYAATSPGPLDYSAQVSNPVMEDAYSMTHAQYDAAGKPKHKDLWNADGSHKAKLDALIASGDAERLSGP